MKRVFIIGWKDLILAFRDKAALVLMLAAPFLLTLGLGFVTGAFSGSDSSGISDIPVVLVNQDDGQLGKTLVELFQSANLANLVEPTIAQDAQLARQEVDNNNYAAAIIIPTGFTHSIIPEPGTTSAPSEVLKIELYTNPTQVTYASVIKTIVDGFISQVEVGRVSAQVTVQQLLMIGLITPDQAAAIGAQAGANRAGKGNQQTAITLKKVISGGETVPFNMLAYMSPGMALMFLMFTTSNGGRTLLAERTQGTLPRLLVSPTTYTQVLGGKVFGIYLTGVAQMLVLIVASTLMFRLDWGDPLGVLGVVLAAVAGAVGWGMLITALAKTPGQVAAVGTAVMLTFGILGGTFIDTANMSPLFVALSKMTPNAWGLDGFLTLALGGNLGSILTQIAALLVMGGVLFTISVLIISRRGIARP